MCSILCVHPSAGGHSGCFRVAAVTNAVMNWEPQVSPQELISFFFFFLVIHPDLELLDHAPRILNSISDLPVSEVHINGLRQGSPASGLWTGTGPCLLGTGLYSRR